MQSNRDYLIENLNLIKQINELKIQNQCLKNEYDILKSNLEEKTEVIADLRKKNQELKVKADKYDELCLHNVMESQDFGNDLIIAILNQSKRVNGRNKELRQENETLKALLSDTKESYTNTLLENEKLKKAIEILKRDYTIRLENHGPHYHIIVCGNIRKLTQQEYKLLKEVLE